MKDKYSDNNSIIDFGQGEYKEGAKYPLSKYDYDLYDDAKAIPTRVIRIKRMGSIAKNERWRIFENDQLKFVLDGEKLSKKEKAFLRGIEGINWLIGECKVGFKSFNELRGRLKQKV